MDSTVPASGVSGQAAVTGVVELVQDVAKVDIQPRLEGRNMAMLLTPK
jgi:translation initiation factor IF-3